MEGVLPPEISNLSELVHINFAKNAIDGGVPSSWVHLQKLGEYNYFCCLLIFTTIVGI